MNFAISYSGGKDSALALYRMINQGHSPVALITTLNIDQKRSWFHGIQPELLHAVSDSLHIPLILCECTPDDYMQSFEKGLNKARQIGVDSCVFGDIDIHGHKLWNEERCKSVGLNCILPLWHEEREELAYEMLSVGFKAIIKIVDSDKLGDSFLGKTLTIPLLDRIKSTGADVCGENGEYHTFVYDGPVFSYPIPIKTGELVDFGTYKALEILQNRQCAL